MKGTLGLLGHHQNSFMNGVPSTVCGPVNRIIGAGLVCERTPLLGNDVN